MLNKQTSNLWASLKRNEMQKHKDWFPQNVLSSIRDIMWRSLYYELSASSASSQWQSRGIWQHIRAFLAHMRLFSVCNGIDILVRMQSGKSHPWSFFSYFNSFFQFLFWKKIYMMLPSIFSSRVITHQTSRGVF